MRRCSGRLTLLALRVLRGLPVLYRIKDQQAQAVTRTPPDVVVGTVLPARQAAIFSKVSGYIRRIHAERGDFVTAGQALVEIDDQELRAAADQARAVADNDARQAARMKTLFERELVAAIDFENARTTAESSRASVQAALARLRVAEVQIATAQSQVRLAQAQAQGYRAALELAETNPANARLRAPFSGYVSQRNLDPGAAVSAQSAGTNTASVGILTLQGIQTVTVQIEVPERNIGRVTVGSPVRGSRTRTRSSFKGRTS